jgi:hypothetical protein
VSLQFSILKVLAGQPYGRATVADLNRYITLLSVPEWTTRMKRLSALAPDLDIFGSQYVLRYDAGWQITEAGHAFLAATEGGAPATREITLEIIVAPAPGCPSSAPRLRLVADNRQGGRRARAQERTNRSRVA